MNSRDPFDFCDMSNCHPTETTLLLAVTAGLGVAICIGAVLGVALFVAQAVSGLMLACW